MENSKKGIATVWKAGWPCEQIRRERESERVRESQRESEREPVRISVGLSDSLSLYGSLTGFLALSRMHFCLKWRFCNYVKLRHFVAKG